MCGRIRYKWVCIVIFLGMLGTVDLLHGQTSSLEVRFGPTWTHITPDHLFTDAVNRHGYIVGVTYQKTTPGPVIMTGGITVD